MNETREWTTQDVRRNYDPFVFESAQYQERGIVISPFNNVAKQLSLFPHIFQCSYDNKSSSSQRFAFELYLLPELS